MVRVSNTGRHSFPTTSYLVIFLLPSRIFPTGFFNSCALLGHSAFSGGGGVFVFDFGGVTSSTSGALYGGGGGDVVVISNLRGS